jgi:hypothetical protein
MMTAISYVFAMAIYIAAACAGARLIHRLVLSGLPYRLDCVLTGLISGVLLVPSYASSEAETLAPALVTALFNGLFSGGLEAARGALMMLGVGAVTGLMCGLIWARLSTSRL